MSYRRNNVGNKLDIERLGAAVRRKREALGYSQFTLEVAIRDRGYNYPQNHISKLELGKIMNPMTRGRPFHVLLYLLNIDLKLFLLTTVKQNGTPQAVS